MLNELYHLSVVLETCKVETEDWHKYLKPLPNATEKRPCYRIWLGPRGLVAGIDPLGPEAIAPLRKWTRNNGDSFPGFNIQPLYRITDEDKKNHLKKMREGKAAIDLSLLRRWLGESHAVNWDDLFGKKINKCLVEIPRELQKKCSAMPKNFVSFIRLCERAFEFGSVGYLGFFEALESCLWKSLESGKQGLVLLPIMIHEGSSGKSPGSDRGSVSVFLDVPDWGEFPVAHEETIRWVNRCLIAGEQPSARAGDGREDAFGEGDDGESEKLPEVKLPVIGGVKLRAMNGESPCQYRYGTIDALSFRVGSGSRKRAKAALEWLKDESREGQTWGRVDSRELLFAYPTIMPKVAAKLASCMGARKQDDTEARFARYAEDVVSCLSGIRPSLKEIEIRVFSLRKMDKARTKVVFHRNYSAQRLADATREWQEGCSNIPRIQIKAWGEEKGKTVPAEVEAPFPLQVADCINRFWRLDGTSGDEVKCIAKSSGIELLLDETAGRRLAPHLLAVALQNSKGLFVSLGSALHSDKVLNLGGLNKQMQFMPAILGLALWKLGILKEVYMSNAPYLVGRMLKIADELHALYCKEVRSGSMPPQLLGNALMVAALDSPTQAISQMALRIGPYLGWARTNSSGVAGLSRYFLKEFGQIGGMLRDATIPSRLDDPARAQLLLGYISSSSESEEDNRKG